MPNLIIHNLIKRAGFIEKGVELDNVRILGRKSDRLARCNGMAGVETELTEALYWLEVPSKQSTITRGWRTVESVDMGVAARGNGCADPIYRLLCAPLWRCIRQSGRASSNGYARFDGAWRCEARLKWHSTFLAVVATAGYCTEAPQVTTRTA